MAGEHEDVFVNIIKEVHSIADIVPPLQCSFPWHLHPLNDHLKLNGDAWILAHFSHLSASTEAGGSAFQADHLVKSGFPFLSSLTFPSAVPSRIEPILKLIAWLFLFDNVLDNPAEMGANAAAADALLNCIVAVLEQPTYTYSGDSLIIKTMVKTAQDWWYATRQGMSCAQQARFIAFFKNYLDANRTGIAYRTSGTLPTLQSYMQFRAEVGAWKPCTVLIEYALCIELDEETLNHPLLLALHSAANYHICWVNDVCSFRKEVLENDFVNVVAVMYCHNVKQLQKKDVSLEGVMGEVCAMIKEYDEECVRLVAEIKASKLLMSKAGMGDYLEGVENWMAGNKHWHLVSGRYGNISRVQHSK